MNKHKLIDKKNKAENAKQQTHLYREGNLVLLQKGTEKKYITPFQDPYSILWVNEKGTVSLILGVVKDTHNIRRITFYINANVYYHGEQCIMLQQKSQKANPNVKWTDSMSQIGHVVHLHQTGTQLIEYSL